jgi:hypothetical protein
MPAKVGSRLEADAHITDPATLLTYVSDVRRYWYCAVAGSQKVDPVINSERIVSTFTYR